MIKMDKIKTVTKLGAAIVALCLMGGVQVSAQALVNNNGAVISITSGADVIVRTGSVDNIAGSVHNAGQLIVEGDYRNGDTTTGFNTSGGVFRVEQDWINDGAFIADTSLVELYGANQLITGTEVSAFYDLELTGTGIKSQTLDAITTNTLNLNDRELDTDVNKHFVTNTDVAAIARTTGFVSSLGAGRLSREMNSTGTYLFPTGSSAGIARYRPLEVTPTTATTQTIEARLGNVNATTEGFDVTVREFDLCDVNDEYFHLIGRTQGADAVDLEFFFDQAEPWSTVAHWQNLPQWEDIGPATAGTVLPFQTLAISGWNDFSPEAFALALPEVAVDTAGAVITDVTCYGGNDGAIDISVSAGTSPITYQWSVPSNQQDVSGLEAGTYTLVISDSNGCNRGGLPYTFVVDEPDSIELTAATTDPTCNGLADGEIDLTITNAVPQIQSITWSNAASTEDIEDLVAGTYSVEVVDANGCTQTLAVELDNPAAIVLDITTEDLDCFGDGSGIASLDVSGGAGGFTYLWSDSSTNQNLTGADAGSYSVTVIDANNCAETEDNIFIDEPNELTLTASADETILVGYTTELEVLSSNGGTGMLTYEWAPANDLSNPNSDMTDATPMETTTYLVTGTDDNGCTAVDTVVITVNDVPFIAPTGFTPNGDNLNDRFELVTSPAVTVGELKIFNRWGQLISDDPTGWDGTYKSKGQAMDTYIYQAVIIFPDGEKKPYQGEVILIR